MGVMKDLSYDVEALFIDGCSPTEIAKELNIPVSIVKEFLTSFGVDSRDLEDEPYSPYYGA